MELYDSLQRKKKLFRPRHKNKVKVFTCGPSIYRRPHIGNYRTFLYEDTLVKYLEYIGYTVEQEIVMTDIEDKGISEAHHKKRELEKITTAVKKHFFKEIKFLNITLPKSIPDSADSVKTAVIIIKKLLRAGYAYYYHDDIYFDPSKKKDFGKLFHLNMEKWPKKHIHYKRDNYDGNHWFLGDFILWHHANPQDDIFWRTSLGKGRPAWHIQDPALILKTLGPQVDINCGGIDNIYRHHDYTIAILEAYSDKSYANYYLLGQHLYVDGKKMSKSSGNIIYPGDLAKGKIKAQQVRFFLNMVKHYRQKLYFTKEKFTQQIAKLDDCRGLIKKLLQSHQQTQQRTQHVSVEKNIRLLGKQFEQHMNDDLNTPHAFKAVHAQLKKMAKYPLARSQQIRLKKLLRKIDSVWNVLF